VARELSSALRLDRDPRYAERLERLGCDLFDAATLYDEVCREVAAGGNPQLRYSAAKLVSAELFQRVGECLQDLAGESAPAPGVRTTELKARAARLFLLSRPVTIFGGTAEIQRDLIARMILPR
jgi:alkylation response protein AidB-like acyl-CoA dehydrogenase